MSVPWVAAIPVGILAIVYLVALIWSLEHFVDGQGWRPALLLWGPILIGISWAAGMLVLQSFGVRVS